MPVSMKPWRVLLVDDDPAVLRLGELLLASVSFEERAVEVLLAKSAAEAKEVILATPDLAVAIVDVIMETPTAGLDLTTWLAAQATHAATRVVIHSGQPASMRQDAVERRYEIHDYWHKSAVNAGDMRTRLLFQLRNYRDVLRYTGSATQPSPQVSSRLWSMAYMSTWVGTPSLPDIQSLAETSREKNKPAGITGLLMVDGSRILQFLEGERDALEALFDKIAIDPRHQDVEQLFSQSQSARAFSSWTMRLITHHELPGRVSTTLFETIRTYASGHRPTPGNFTQLLLSILESSDSAPRGNT